MIKPILLFSCLSIVGLLNTFALGGCAAFSSRAATPSVPDAPSVGEVNAPFQVVMFSDFQCPYCRSAALRMNEVIKEYPKKVHLTFKHFPLRQHPQAAKAAAASEAARMQGKFWEMHDLLFNNAPSLSDASYSEFAAMLGLDVEKFTADMSSETVAARIAADRAEADILGLDGTPFLVVNGKPYRGSFVDLIRDIENR
jgi:protein-disulfide isomerase